ncbi:MAG TPA: amidohydrolase family protein [Chthoniobacteraceae bacterium]|nr:amidohydrolase family protein [Chthoniobacteraceae bacterium]
MLIDAHVHIGKSARLQIDCNGEMLVRVADQLGIEHIFCTDLTALFYDMHEGNRLLYDEMRRFPDRIIGYASLHSTRFGQAALDELERCRHDYRMSGLKIYSTPEATIAEPAMIPILEKCVELDFVVLAHTTPHECEYLMAAVPECRFLMAHAGGQPFAKGDWNRAIMAAKRFPNLYLETASSTIDTHFLETAVAELGPERIIFGTDTPLLDPWVQLTKIRETALDRRSRDLILGGNIARLIGLPA